MSEPDLLFPNAASPEIREFLIQAHAYVAAAKPKLTSASLSSIVFSAGKQIERLENGCDLTTGRLRAAWTKLRALQAGGPRTRKSPTRSKGASDGEERPDQPTRDEEVAANVQPRRSAGA